MHEDRRSARTVEKSRGRVETRILTTTTLSNDHLNWPGVQQTVRLERITIRRGIETRTVQYALTSVSRKRANTDDLLRWLRGRWAVENTGFWVRDMTFNDDHCRIRTVTSPDVFSRIRNAAINAMKALGGEAMARRHKLSDVYLERNFSAMRMYGGRVGEAVKVDWSPERVFMSFLRRVET